MRPPIGYVYDPLGRLVVDIAEQVQLAHRLLFDLFEQSSSARAVARHFHTHHLQFPRRIWTGACKGQLAWRDSGSCITRPMRACTSTDRQRSPSAADSIGNRSRVQSDERTAKRGARRTSQAHRLIRRMARCMEQARCPLDKQQILRKRTDACESLGTHPSRRAHPRLGFTPDVGTLDRAARLAGGIRRMPVPDRSVVNDEGARRATGQYLSFAVCFAIVHVVAWNGGPLV
jgi:hypothetical protein